MAARAQMEQDKLKNLTFRAWNPQHVVQYLAPYTIMHRVASSSCNTIAFNTSGNLRLRPEAAIMLQFSVALAM